MSRVRLDTFLEDLRHQVESFEAMWRQEHRKAPKDYTLTQESMAEWHDQFAAWLSLEDEPEDDK